MPRKTTSIKIEIELWKLAKKKCIDIDSEISTYIEKLIRKDIGAKNKNRQRQNQKGNQVQEERADKG